MDKKIENLKNQAEAEIKNCADLKSLEEIKIKYLGRKGELTSILRSLVGFSIEEKRIIGPKSQALKNQLDELIEKRKKELSGKKDNVFDISRPGKKIKIGHMHPLSLLEREIIEIFQDMSFSVIDGPEIESEYYNFDALNIPKNHPARDKWDTFWLDQPDLENEKGRRLLLRTHTSPMQIRYMEKHKPPFQIIVPGKAFRYEATDASHEMNFIQVEGLMVGNDVSLANFKYVIREFFRRLFKKKIEIRMRPELFPFVEPGLEVDVQCVKCGGKGLIPQSGTADRAKSGLGLIPQSGTADRAKSGLGCNVCKESGWLEVMGAGMVHPNVFKAAGYNPKDYQGFAFGLGLERIAMLKYNIPDIRMFYNGDLRFINQF